MIGNACRVDPERPQLVAPCQSGALVLERADGLPPLKARIVDRHWRILRGTSPQAKETHARERTVARRNRTRAVGARGDERSRLTCPNLTRAGEPHASACEISSEHSVSLDGL